MILLSRPAGAVAFAALLALAGWAGTVEKATPNIRLARADPAAYAGVLIKVARESRVEQVRPDGAVVVRENALDARVVVRGITSPCAPGDPISVLGRFVPPDGLDAVEHRVHRTRMVKVWVSLPVLAWLAWLLATRLRPTRAGLEER